MIIIKHSLQCRFLSGSWFAHSNFMCFFHYYMTCFGLTRTVDRCVRCCTWTVTLLAYWSCATHKPKRS
jgi:hypothetical protein